MLSKDELIEKLNDHSIDRGCMTVSEVAGCFLRQHYGVEVKEGKIVQETSERA